ncbi:hypothetical protein L1987_21026 [Smallanthus sonchifolius]|uniref:Uncharacterized protein n=1 Tax=Smallanthus sonchifolius TaxID=185202 RepID=A0ACB9ITH9_9ASTR|nr:hypothetical protein L1987_21026 [Smallanthus sonchifolius]
MSLRPHHEAPLSLSKISHRLSSPLTCTPTVFSIACTLQKPNVGKRTDIMTDTQACKALRENGYEVILMNLSRKLRIGIVQASHEEHWAQNSTFWDWYYPARMYANHR